MKDYQAYLFDIDGTVLDTRELIRNTFQIMAKRLDLPAPSQETVKNTIGVPIYRQMRLVLGEGYAEDVYECALETYRAIMWEIYKEYLTAFPGAAETLARLSDMGKKLAVVTSRKKESLLTFLEAANVRRYFTEFVSPEDTDRHKPDPEPALLALKKLGARPEDSVFIGDAEFDILCGRAAGMDTAFVEWGGMDYTRWDVQPDFVARTFADLLPEGA